MRFLNRALTVGRFLFDRVRFAMTWLEHAATGRPLDRDAVLHAMMCRDWDQRAHSDALYWIATRPGRWSESEFFESGESDAGAMLARSGVTVGRGDAVLEVGCGVGRLLRAMLRRGAQGWGVDISPEMIARAAVYLEGEDVRLRVRSAHQLTGLPERYFRLVYSYVVLQHIPDAAMILSCFAQAAKLVSADGVLLMQVRNDHAHARTYNTYSGASVPVEEIREVLARAGCGEVTFEGLGTQYLWVRATRPGSAARERQRAIAA